MSRYKEFDQYEELLKGRLSKKRFTHTMNVAEACYDLAERFGGDKKRCYLAGMLHDIMKEELPVRQKQMTAACGCIGIFDHPYAYPSLTCTQDAQQKKALPTSQAECPPSAFLTS